MTLNKFLQLSGSGHLTGERTITSLHSLYGAQVIASEKPAYLGFIP